TDPPSPQPPSAGSALWVQLSLVSTSLQVEPVREAIARELAVRVTLSPDVPAAATLRIQVRGRLAHFEFRDREHHVVRTLSLPAEEPRAIETLALIAGNLARDEAGELLVSLQAARAETTPPPNAPPPSA